ncbi:hypothetical protein HDU97_007732, partial [Phlyctochytrium planicorne]
QPPSQFFLIIMDAFIAFLQLFRAVIIHSTSQHYPQTKWHKPHRSTPSTLSRPTPSRQPTSTPSATSASNNAEQQGNGVNRNQASNRNSLLDLAGIGGEDEGEKISDFAGDYEESERGGKDPFAGMDVLEVHVNLWGLIGGSLAPTGVPGGGGSAVGGSAVIK